MQIYLSHHAFSSQVYGGVSRYFVELANYYAEHRVPTQIVSPIYINQYLQESRNALRRGIFVRKRAKTGWLIHGINQMVSPLLMKNERAIYHETYYDQFRGAKSAHLKVATVYDCIHDLFPHYFSPTDPSYLNKRATLAKADHVFCISESTRRDLLKFYPIPAQKISVVPLAVKAPLAQGSTRPRPEPYFLFVGTRARYKNAEALFRAFAGSKAANGSGHLVFFGGGAFTESERLLAQELGIADRLSQRGGSDEDLYRYYRHAEAFIFPSEYEGFGLPTLEAMSVGCPVICSNTSSFPEVAGEAALFHDPKSVEGLRGHLDRLFENREERELWGQAGLLQNAKFSWEQTARQTLEVYERVFSA